MADRVFAPVASEIEPLGKPGMRGGFKKKGR
jgi:hypothetical protein